MGVIKQIEVSAEDRVELERTASERCRTASPSLAVSTGVGAFAGPVPGRELGMCGEATGRGWVAPGLPLGQQAQRDPGAAGDGGLAGVREVGHHLLEHGRGAVADGTAPQRCRYAATGARGLPTARTQASAFRT